MKTILPGTFLSVFKIECPIESPEITVVITPELTKLIYRTMLSKRNSSIYKFNKDVVLFIEWYKNKQTNIIHSVIV